MKKIGLLGGMSWESTLNYYKAINQQVKERLGGLNSAELILNSVNFSEIEKLQHQGDWQELAQRLSGSAIDLKTPVLIAYLFAPTPCIKWLIKWLRIFQFL